MKLLIRSGVPFVVLLLLAVSIQASNAASDKKVYTVDQLSAAGWKLDRPPYPFTAQASHEQGNVYLELITDAEGKVVKAITAKETNHPNLDTFTAQWIRAHWHGPANSDVITFVVYKVV